MCWDQSTIIVKSSRLHPFLNKKRWSAHEYSKDKTNQTVSHMGVCAHKLSEPVMKVEQYLPRPVDSKIPEAPKARKRKTGRPRDASTGASRKRNRNKVIQFDRYVMTNSDRSGLRQRCLKPDNTYPILCEKCGWYQLDQPHKSLSRINMRTVPIKRPGLGNKPHQLSLTSSLRHSIRVSQLRSRPRYERGYPRT